MVVKHKKHFLDTSILYPMLLGSAFYKDYLHKKFEKDGLYISKYVQMEFIRTYICPILDFYFTLDMPHIKTINDAISVWSDNFRTREVKAVLNFVGQIFDTERKDLNDLKDKKKALSSIERVVFRIYTHLNRKFKDTGINSIRCKRNDKELKFKDRFERKESFRKFRNDFLNDTENQDKCRINIFFSKRFENETESFIKHANRLSKPKDKKNQGFVKISENLNKHLHNGKKATCSFCSSVGDAVIALEAPQNMRLEHTDYSFDHLCEVIDKPHYRHKSQRAVMTSLDL